MPVGRSRELKAISIDDRDAAGSLVKGWNEAEGSLCEVRMMARLGDMRADVLLILNIRDTARILSHEIGLENV